MKKLTIVVTCTDRKTLPAEADLQVRSLPVASVRRRMDVWQARLARGSAVRTLESLYQGESWSQVRKLESLARTRGFKPTILVASAGLGLRRMSDQAPPYAATFSRSSPDSVGVNEAERQSWWKEFTRFDGMVDLVSEGRRFLVILSEAYALPLHDDLVALASSSPQALLFGGSGDVPGIERVASDRRLRANLGGTTTSLNLRMASMWMNQCEDGELIGPGSRARWDSWVQRHSRNDPPPRASLSDEEVLFFIRKTRKSIPSLSASRGLRLLRDSGKACEQGRFTKLFAAETGGR